MEADDDVNDLNTERTVESIGRWDEIVVEPFQVKGMFANRRI